MDNQLNKIQDAFSVYNLAWKFWALVIFEVMYYFDLSNLATFVKIKIHFTYSFIIYVSPNFKKDFQRHKKKWKKKIGTLRGCRKVSKYKRKQCWKKRFQLNTRLRYFHQTEENKRLWYKMVLLSNVCSNFSWTHTKHVMKIQKIMKLARLIDNIIEMCGRKGISTN